MNIVLRGITGLLGSTKGTLSLIIVIGMFILAALGKLDGIGVGACCTLASGIYCFTRAISDRNNMGQPGGSSGTF